MSERETPPTLREMAFELGLKLGQDAKFNQDFEEYIARLDAKFDRTSLTLTLAHCRRATATLAALHRLVRAIAPYEAEVYAIAARGSRAGAEVSQEGYGT